MVVVYGYPQVNNEGSLRSLLTGSFSTRTFVRFLGFISMPTAGAVTNIFTPQPQAGSGLRIPAHKDWTPGDGRVVVLPPGPPPGSSSTLSVRDRRLATRAEERRHDLAWNRAHHGSPIVAGHLFTLTDAPQRNGHGIQAGPAEKELSRREQEREAYQQQVDISKQLPDHGAQTCSPRTKNSSKHAVGGPLLPGKLSRLQQAMGDHSQVDTSGSGLSAALERKAADRTVRDKIYEEKRRRFLSAKHDESRDVGVRFQEGNGDAPTGLPEKLDRADRLLKTELLDKPDRRPATDPERQDAHVTFQELPGPEIHVSSEVVKANRSEDWKRSCVTDGPLGVIAPLTCAMEVCKDLPGNVVQGHEFASKDGLVGQHSGAVISRCVEDHAPVASAAISRKAEYARQLRDQIASDKARRMDRCGEADITSSPACDPVALSTLGRGDITRNTSEGLDSKAEYALQLQKQMAEAQAARRAQKKREQSAAANGEPRWLMEAGVRERQRRESAVDYAGKLQAQIAERDQGERRENSDKIALGSNDRFFLKSGPSSNCRNQGRREGSMIGDATQHPSRHLPTKEDTRSSCIPESHGRVGRLEMASGIEGDLDHLADDRQRRFDHKRLYAEALRRDMTIPKTDPLGRPLDYVTRSSGLTRDHPNNDRGNRVPGKYESELAVDSPLDVRQHRNTSGNRRRRWNLPQPRPPAEHQYHSASMPMYAWPPSKGEPHGLGHGNFAQGSRLRPDHGYAGREHFFGDDTVRDDRSNSVDDSNAYPWDLPENPAGKRTGTHNPMATVNHPASGNDGFVQYSAHASGSLAQTVQQNGTSHNTFAGLDSAKHHGLENGHDYGRYPVQGLGHYTMGQGSDAPPLRRKSPPRIEGAAFREGRGHPERIEGTSDVLMPHPAPTVGVTGTRTMHNPLNADELAKAKSRKEAYRKDLEAQLAEQKRRLAHHNKGEPGSKEVEVFMLQRAMERKSGQTEMPHGCEMGPLGVPVFKDVLPANRRGEEASHSQVKIENISKKPSRHRCFTSMGAVEIPGYEGDAPALSGSIPSPGTDGSGTALSSGGAVASGAGSFPVQRRGQGLRNLLGTEAEGEKERERSRRQAEALRKQVEDNKARRERERTLLEEKEAKEEARLQREREELQRRFEEEEKATKATEAEKLLKEAAEARDEATAKREAEAAKRREDELEDNARVEREQLELQKKYELERAMEKPLTKTVARTATTAQLDIPSAPTPSPIGSAMSSTPVWEKLGSTDHTMRVNGASSERSSRGTPGTLEGAISSRQREMGATLIEERESPSQPAPNGDLLTDDRRCHGGDKPEKREIHDAGRSRDSRTPLTVPPMVPSTNEHTTSSASVEQLKVELSRQKQLAEELRSELEHHQREKFRLLEFSKSAKQSEPVVLRADLERRIPRPANQTDSAKRNVKSTELWKVPSPPDKNAAASGGGTEHLLTKVNESKVPQGTDEPAIAFLEKISPDFSSAAAWMHSPSKLHIPGMSSVDLRSYRYHNSRSYATRLRRRRMVTMRTNASARDSRRSSSSVVCLPADRKMAE